MEDGVDVDEVKASTASRGPCSYISLLSEVQQQQRFIQHALYAAQHSAGLPVDLWCRLDSHPTI
jgi:hypothetical protein